MIRRRGATAAIWLLLGSAVGSLSGVAAPAAGATAPSPPWAVTDKTAAALSDSVHVHGGGWSPGSGLLTVLICGNLAVDGSADCDVANSVLATVGADGAFQTGITVNAPPRPCPCVIRVGTDASPDAVKIPLRITNFSQGSVTAAPSVVRAVRVSDVRLGAGSWTSWFGMASRRTLEYAVTNTGDVVLHRVTTDISSGRGAQPTGFVAAPDIGDLGVQETKVLKTHVSFGALAVGSYRVSLRVDPIGDVGSASVKVVLVPLGLVAALVALGVFLVLRRRRRAHRRPSVAAPVALVPAVPPADDDDLVVMSRRWAGPWIPVSVVGAETGEAETILR